MKLVSSGSLLLSLFFGVTACSEKLAPVSNSKSSQGSVKGKAAKNGAVDSKAQANASVFSMERLPQDIVNLECTGPLTYTLAVTNVGAETPESAPEPWSLREGAEITVSKLTPGERELKISVFVNKELKYTASTKLMITKLSPKEHSIRLTLAAGAKLNMEVFQSSPASHEFGIWNGKTASDLVRASTVSLTYGSGGKSLCSGAIICDAAGTFSADAVWVLTAAHCMTPSYAVIGDDGYSTQDRCTGTPMSGVHPGFKETSGPNGPILMDDMALVQFKCPAAFMAKAKCAVLNDQALSVGQSLTIGGYGKRGLMSPGVLQETTMKVSSLKGLPGPSGPLTANADFSVAEASGTGICSGDSGGPSYIEKNGKLVLTGVHSLGSGCDDTQPYRIAVDVLVNTRLPWINSVTGFSASTFKPPAGTTSVPQVQVPSSGATSPSPGASSSPTGAKQTSSAGNSPVDAQVPVCGVPGAKPLPPQNKTSSPAAPAPSSDESPGAEAPVE